MPFFIFKLYCVSNFCDYVSCHRQLKENSSFEIFYIHTVFLPDWTLKNRLALICHSNVAKDSKDSEQKWFLKSWEGFLRWSNLSSLISTWAELGRAWYIFKIMLNNGTFIALEMKSFGEKKSNSNRVEKCHFDRAGMPVPW